MFYLNVGFLKTDPRARYQGYLFYFNEGFCWTNILNPQARLLKAKLKYKSVNDVGSMSLSSILDSIPNIYLVTAINSELLFDFYREFINVTVNIQINDIRQLPIYIPHERDLKKCEELFKKIVEVKKDEYKKNANTKNLQKQIMELETSLNEFINFLFYVV